MINFTKRFIGIEMNDHQVHIVDLTRSKGRVKKAKSYSIPLEEGWIKNAEVVEPDLLYNYLKPLLKKYKLSNPKVNLLAPSQHVVNRSIQLPKVKEKERRALVEKEVFYHMHLPFEQPLWDFHVLNEADQMMDVMVFAASSKVIDSQMSVLKRLGVTVTSVDLRGLALQRVVNSVSNHDPKSAYGILLVEKDSIDLAFYYRTELLFQRNLMSLEDAATMENLLIDANPSDEYFPMEEFVSELTRSVNYFSFTVLQDDVQLERMFVFAPGTEQPLVEQACEAIGLSTYIIREGNFPGFARLTMEALTAYGLALKEDGYRK